MDTLVKALFLLVAAVASTILFFAIVGAGVSFFRFLTGT